MGAAVTRMNGIDRTAAHGRGRRCPSASSLGQRLPIEAYVLSSVTGAIPGFAARAPIWVQATVTSAGTMRGAVIM